jgi:hypothetical protein
MNTRRILNYACGTAFVLGVGACEFSEKQTKSYRSLANEPVTSSAQRESFTDKVEQYTTAQNASYALMATGFVGLILLNPPRDNKKSEKPSD